MADKHHDKRSESQWEETWGNPSYVYSKTGTTPDDIREERARREAEHEASKEKE